MDKTLQTHVEPLPRTKDELVELFKRAIELPNVDEVKISTREGFIVRRMVGDEEQVMPKPAEVEELDPDFVMQRLELDELDYVNDEHPLQTLARGTREITVRGYLPSHFFTPAGEWVQAILDLPDGVAPPTHCLGMRVAEFQSEAFQEKFVLVGGPTHYLSDACFGVIVDMGI